MGLGLSLDPFVGEFVAVVLDEIFKFDPGEPDEWLTRSKGCTESKLLVAVQEFDPELIHRRIPALLVRNLSLEQD